jgi:catechol 2,3-dioxygenase-like lactoylglutathione lyase family enzyme
MLYVQRLVEMNDKAFAQLATRIKQAGQIKHSLLKERNMTAIRGISEIVLWVRDMTTSLKFYRDTLGLTIISPPEMKSPVFLKAGEGEGVPQMLVLLQLPVTALGTSEAAPYPAPRTLHHLALEVAPADYDAEHARLTALGFQLRTGKHPVIPSRTMYLNDPDGNEVELICKA